MHNIDFQVIDSKALIILGSNAYQKSARTNFRTYNRNIQNQVLSRCLHALSRRNDLDHYSKYFFTTDSITNEREISEAEYEKVADETLHALSEMFDDIADTVKCDPEYDVSFETGVLTVKISNSWGTYVMNKQTPNKQIWLSSPISGPFRYDYINKQWIYKRDGTSLHTLLSKEISEALGHELDFTSCLYGGSFEDR